MWDRFVELVKWILFDPKKDPNQPQANAKRTSAQKNDPASQLDKFEDFLTELAVGGYGQIDAQLLTYLSSEGEMVWQGHFNAPAKGLNFTCKYKEEYSRVADATIGAQPGSTEEKAAAEAFDRLIRRTQDITSRLSTLGLRLPIVVLNEQGIVMSDDEIEERLLQSRRYHDEARPSS